ncbi:MAG: DUF4870 domain-containing protein [Opitutales bacterium]|nr:DUF4870 domain-containing protein [Opitutales bacterium]
MEEKTENLPTPTESQADNDKTFAVLTHFMPLIGQLLPGAGTIIGPVIWWVLMKDKYPMVNEHGKEVLNFAISYFIYTIAASILLFVLIGFFLLAVIGIASLIFMIIGAIKASNGELFRYPLTIRFLK